MANFSCTGDKAVAVRDPHVPFVWQKVFVNPGPIFSLIPIALLFLDSTVILSDLHQFDPLRTTWTDLTYSCLGDFPSPRTDHAVTSIDDKIYIFGGLYTGEHHKGRVNFLSVSFPCNWSTSVPPSRPLDPFSSHALPPLWQEIQGKESG